MKNKKIIIDIIIVIAIILIIILSAPKIFALKMENAIANGNGAEFADLYETWVISQNEYIGNSVNEVVNNWLPVVIEDFNNQFCNGESKKEMDSYLKDKYGSIFISDNIEDSLMRVYYKYDNGELKFIGDKYGQRINNVMFGKMYVIRESKIAFVEADIINKIEEYEKFEKEIEKNEPYWSNIQTAKAYTELNARKGELFCDVLFINLDKEDTYYLKYNKILSEVYKD